MSSEPTAAPDFAAIKNRQQAVWASGNYAMVGNMLQLVPEQLCEAMDLRGGWRVLDVAAGSGIASLAAAHRCCEVTSTDYVPALLERGRARAAAEGLRLDFRTADAENLPFADHSFDAALSTFGMMFTPDQPRAAAELFRVVRPGGRIGLACWTPVGFVGQMFRVIGRHVPPPAGLASPLLWGTEPRLRELFPAAAKLAAAKRSYTFYYRSPRHFVDTFRTSYGPMVRSFDALNESGQAALAADLLALIHSANRSGDGTMLVDSEYLEVIITK